MLTSIYLKTLRDYRWSILGWGAGAGLLNAALVVSWIAATATPEAHATFTREMARMASSIQFYGEPRALDTLGGYFTWRYSGFVPVLASIFAVLAGSFLVRGEEERGTLEMLLSMPRGRIRVLAELCAALASALMAIGALLWVGMAVPVLVAQLDLNLARAALAMLNTVAVALLFAALAVLAAQLVRSRRAAGGLAAAAMVGTYVLQSVANTVDSAEPLRPLSPFWYHARSKPLVPGSEMDWAAFLALLGLAGLFILLAAPLFARRDLGATALRRSGGGGPVSGTERRGDKATRGHGDDTVPIFASARLRVSTSGGLSRLLPLTTDTRYPVSAVRHFGTVLAFNLRELRWPVFWWALGISLFGAVIVSLAPRFAESLTALSQSLPFMPQLRGPSVALAYVSFGFFGFLPMLVAAFVLTQVSRWAGDREEGRLELVLATPGRRWQVLTGYAAGALAALVALLLLVAVATGAIASLVGLELDRGRLAEAAIGLVPLALLVLAVGLCAAAWLRAAVALGVVTAVVVAQYFVEFMGELLRLPEWVRRLSIFHSYGQPLIDGLRWLDTGIVLLAAVAFALVALVSFERRDLRA